MSNIETINAKRAKDYVPLQKHQENVTHQKISRKKITYTCLRGHAAGGALG